MIYVTIHCNLKVIPTVTDRTPLLDLYIRVVDDIILTGVYHEVGDFNLQVINSINPQSNVNSVLVILHFIRYPYVSIDGVTT